MIGLKAIVFLGDQRPVYLLTTPLGMERVRTYLHEVKTGTYVSKLKVPQSVFASLLI